MLRVVPTHWYSWDFTVLEGSEAIAEIDISWWREKGWLRVRDESYRVSREGWVSGSFTLESSGSILAQARKPSAFRRSFVVEHGGRQFTLNAKSAFGRAFVLSENSRALGSLAPDGWLTRRATADLPEDLPLSVRVFIVWLAVILWKRESDSAAAGAG